MVKVLVIKLSSLGDLFHALPAVHNLKHALNAQIDWVTQPEYVELVKCFDDVDRVIPFHRKAFCRNFWRLFRDVRRYEYDYVLDLQGLLKSGIVAKLARAEKKIGPSFHREGSRLLYSDVAGARDKQRHAYEENLDVIRYLELEVLEPEFPVTFPEWETDMPSPRVALIPSSRWTSKNWPEQSFIMLGRRLWEEAAVSLFILGGRDDVELCGRIEAALGGAVENLAGKTSVVELGSVLAGMDLVVANDSGPMHMAAAVGTRVLGIFGPTDPIRTGPAGRWHHVVAANLECRPCFEETCRFGEARCLNVISPDAVADTAVKMLAQ